MPDPVFFKSGIYTRVFHPGGSQGYPGRRFSYGVVQMQKQIKIPALILFILLQALVGSCLGIFALSGYRTESLPESVYVGDISIGGMNYEEAGAKLSEYNDFLRTNGRLQIEVGEDSYTISYDDIDAEINVEATLDKIFHDLSGYALSALVAGADSRREYEPVVVFNEGKLSAQTEKIFGRYNHDPVPASYRVENGKLVYIPETPGIKLDYRALEKRISDHIGSLDENALVIPQDDPEIFASVSSDVSDKVLDFRYILSSSRIPLGETVTEEEKEIAEALNGNIVKPGEKIKLSEMLDLKNPAPEGRKDLLNRAATAVYQAFLPIKGIISVNRRQSETILPYAEPGLEAVIEGEYGDLVLENSSGETLMLLCEIRDRMLCCYVAAPDDIPSGIIASVRRDFVEPPVIYTVTGDLKKGESRVVSEGQAGFTVEVVRIIGNERVTLYTDRYDPVSCVVEVGESPLQTGSK